MVVKKILSINKESAVTNFQPNSKQNGRCNLFRQLDKILIHYLSTQLKAKWSLQLRKLEEWLGLSSGVNFDKPRKNSPISFSITAETILSKAWNVYQTYFIEFCRTP